MTKKTQPGISHAEMAKLVAAEIDLSKLATTIANRIFALVLAMAVFCYLLWPSSEQAPPPAKNGATQGEMMPLAYYQQFLVETPNAHDRHYQLYGGSSPEIVTDIRGQIDYPDAKTEKRIKAKVTIKK